MAFSPEVRFRIGADTSALSSAFIKAQSIAATAGAQIQRKLGMKDAFKGLMQGIGIGSVDSISNLVVSPFKAGAEEAKLMADQTASLLDISTRAMSALGGPKRDLDLKKKKIRDMNVDIEMQTKLVSELDTPMKFVNPAQAIMLMEARQELSKLVTTQADLAAQTKVYIELENRKTKSVYSDYALEADLIDQKTEKQSELYQLQLKMDALTEKNRLRFKQGASESELAEITGKQMVLMAQMRAIKAKAQDAVRDQGAAAGSMLIGSGKGRGRSEAERLADRGASYMKRAEEAAKTGHTPEYVRQLALLGRTDLRSAGKRLNKATSLIGDDLAVGNQLLQANNHLKEISKNLTPTKIK